MSTIIVVDDREQDRYMLKVLLQGKGYDVRTFAHGAQALEYARLNTPDVIVTDIMMPVMDGFTLCRECKNDKTLMTIPFIFYTATYTDPRDEQFALSLGAEKFIVKPIDIENLLSTIKQIIKKDKTIPAKSPAYSSNDETEYYKEYSEVLVRKLEDKMTHLETVVETAANVIICMSTDYKITEFNRAAEYFFRVNKSDVIGKSFMDICNKNTGMNNILMNIPHVLTEKALRQVQTEFNTPEGNKHIFLWNVDPMKRAFGELIGILAIGTDITERKQSQKEKLELEKHLLHAQKMEAIGTLTGGIAHDFNNILFGIMGYMDMALNEIPLEDQSAYFLRKALKNVDRAKELVKQILTFSRQTEHKFRPLKIRLILKNALKLLRSSLPKTIRIQDQVNTECGNVLADPAQIHQIIMNLCTNAYHAMEKQSNGILSVSLNPIEISEGEKIDNFILTPGTYILLEVSDTGTGMDAQTIDRMMYEPYFTTKEENKGTGLGLAIIHNIIKNHNGHLSVYSEIGIGTTFKVYLPQCVPENKQNHEPKTADLPKGSEHILIVEDESILLDMLKTMLQSLGYTVTKFKSSQAALKHYFSSPEKFDCIITDMTLPFMTGAELSQRILAHNPDIPIVLCTGFSEIITEEKAKAIGIKAFLMKPFIKHQIAEVIRHVIDNSNKTGVESNYIKATLVKQKKSARKPKKPISTHQNL